MPISGGNSSSLDQDVIAALIEALSGGGFGGGLGIPAYRFTKMAEIDAPAEQKTLLLPPTLETQLREVTITNLSDFPIDIIYNSEGEPYKLFTLHPNGTFIDSNDGGTRIEAIAPQSAKIRVAVRSETEILYDVGVESMPFFPVQVSLHFPTGDNYPTLQPTDVNEPISAAYEGNLQRLFNSDNFITGYKALSFNCFTPGEDLTIEVEALGGLYDSKIQLQLVHPLRLVRVLTDVMSDLINPESASLPDNFMGRITLGSWAGEVASPDGGLITFQPNFNQCMGRFCAKKPGTDYVDTCIIKEYIPNADPLKGGKFVLEGF